MYDSDDQMPGHDLQSRRMFASMPCRTQSKTLPEFTSVFTRSHVRSVGHIQWVIFSGSYSVGHIQWVIFSESYSVGHIQ